MYIGTVAYLGKLYDFINEHLFGGELVKPVITVQVDSRNKAYGWWSVNKVWHENKDDEGVHELNMCAQYLNRPTILPINLCLYLQYIRFVTYGKDFYEKQTKQSEKIREQKTLLSLVSWL